MVKIFDLQEKITEFLTIMVIGIAFFQILSLGISAIFPSVKVIKLGILFMVLAISGSILGSIMIVRQTSIGKLDKSTLNYIILATVAMILFLFFGKELIPEIFDKQQFVESMSIVMSSVGF